MEESKNYMLQQQMWENEAFACLKHLKCIMPKQYHAEYRAADILIMPEQYIYHIQNLGEEIPMHTCHTWRKITTLIQSEQHIEAPKKRVVHTPKEL